MKSSDYRYGNVIPVPGIVRYTAGPTAPQRINCIAKGTVDGNTVYVQVGENGLIQTSPDLVTWTTRTSGVSVMLNFVIYDSYTSKFWAVGASGTMLSSSDGITWSAVSLPVEVATDNLTGIATDGAGTFVVSNGTTGSRFLLSTDSGANWTAKNANGANGSSAVHFDGQYWIAGRNVGTGVFMLTWASDASGTWTQVSVGSDLHIVTSIKSDGVNRIISSTSGLIATSPLSGSPGSGNWTVRSSGTTESLRLTLANGRVYAVGQNGISLESTDNGETWQAGPPIGTTEFMRYGLDAGDGMTALVVGDAGIMRLGEYGAKIGVYTSNTDRNNDQSGKYSAPFSFAETPKAGVKITIP